MRQNLSKHSPCHCEETIANACALDNRFLAMTPGVHMDGRPGPMTAGAPLYTRPGQIIFDNFGFPAIIQHI